MKRRLAASLVAVFAFVCLLRGEADAAPPLPAFLAQGLAWETAQIKSDGSLIGEASSVAIPLQNRSEALSAIAALSGAAPSALAAAIAAASTGEVTELIARQAIAARLSGGDPGALLANIASRQNSDGGFPALANYASDPLETAWALLALATDPHAEMRSIKNALAFLSSDALPQGGWGPVGTNPDPYVTAYVLLGANAWKSRVDVGSIATPAMASLASTLQTAGPTSNASKALFLLALATQTADSATLVALVDALKAAQKPDGSWDEDPYTTALVLRALWQAASPLTDAGKMAGRVVEAASGQALSGVTISLQADAGTQLKASTDANGQYAFSGLSADHWHLRADYQGYQEQRLDFSLAAGESYLAPTLALQVDAGSGNVRGVVSRASDGTPLAGATVQVAGTPALSTTSAADGSYRLTGVAPGNLQVTASAPGYLSASGNGQLAAGGVLIFSPSLFASGATPGGQSRVSGQVVDQGTSAPVSGVRIEIDAVGTLNTGVDGRFETNLDPGGHRLNYVASGYAALTQTLLLSAGSPVDLGLIRLSPQRSASRLFGRVTGPGNAPLAGATLALAGGATASTDSDGRYVLDALSGTQFSLTVSAAGYLGESVQLNLSPAGDYQQDFSLTPQRESGLQLSALSLSPASVGAETAVTVHGSVTQTGNAPLAAVIVLRVRDAHGRNIGTGVVRNGTQTIGRFDLQAGQTLALSGEWNSAQFAPGSYTLEFVAVVPGTMTRANPEGDILGVSGATLLITADWRIAGTVSAQPPVQRAGSASPITLAAQIRNDGNARLDAQNYRLQITNTQTGNAVYDQRARGVVLEVNALGTLAFPDWTPGEAGDYQLTVTAENATGTAAGTAYVGDAATASFTVSPQKLGSGRQTVRAHLSVTGQDSVNGHVSDPLAPLIKTAIQKAVTFNDLEAYTWTLKNSGCEGCHIQSQAVVGGETNRRSTTWDAHQRATIVNTLSTAGNSNGALDANYVASAYQQTITTLALWGLDALQDKTSIVATLKRAGDYLLSRQDPSGRWQIDYWDSHGWWESEIAHTALNLRGLAHLSDLLKATDPNEVRNYAQVPYLPDFREPSRGFITADAHGNLYFPVMAAGKVVEITPDGKTGLVWNGLGDPHGVVPDKNGNGLLVATDSGLFRLGFDGSITRLNTNTCLDTLAYSPDGRLFSDGYACNAIYEISDSGEAAVWTSGGPLSNPSRLIFAADGSMLVSNWGGYNILRYRPDKSFEVVVEAMNPLGRPTNIQRYKDSWLVTTTSGALIYNDDWIGERILIGGGNGETTLLPSGRLVLAAWSQPGLSEIVSTPAPVGPALTTYDTAIDKASTWLVNQDLSQQSDSLQLAQQMIGLTAATRYYGNTARAAAIQAKLESVGALLWARQNSDGGWGRNWYGAGNNSNWASDSMATAQIGYALDVLNPSPDSPPVRKAITWLLSRQQADGSWISENGILSTKEAATTWVAIWLPVALDRLGGIDSALALTLPAASTLANPTLAPDLLENLGAGARRYTWQLPSVTAAGRAVEFDLTLDDLKLGETRPVVDAASLSFKNSFTGNTETAPIDIPSVTVSAFMTVDVGTDRASYPANTAVSIRSHVANTGLATLAGRVAWTMLAADGSTVAELAAQPFAGLAAGTQSPLDAHWNTGTTATGDYVVEATLFDAAGIEVMRSRAAFTIVGPSTPASTLSSSVATDKARYHTDDRVLISAAVDNLTLNAALNDLTVEEVVTGPAGTTVHRATQPLAQLLPGAHRRLEFRQTLVKAAPGDYIVTQRVLDAQQATLDTRSATYTVESSAASGFGLKGSIVATPRVARVGDTVLLTAAVTNTGNADLKAVPLTIAVLDPTTHALLKSWTQIADLPQGRAVTRSEHWLSTHVLEGQYLVTLSATLPGAGLGKASSGELPLAQDAVTLSGLAPPTCGAPVLGSFTASTAAPNTLVTSNSITVSGLGAGCTASASVSNGRYQAMRGGSNLTGGFSASSVSVQDGDQISLQTNAPATSGSSTTVTLSVGAVNGNWHVTAAAAPPVCAAPVLGSFAPSTAAPNALVTSNSITVSGMGANCSANASISNGLYQVMRGASNLTGGYIASAVSVQDGDAITLQTHAPGSSGNGLTVGLTVGGSTATWLVTALAALNPSEVPVLHGLLALALLSLSVLAIARRERQRRRNSR